MKTSWKLDQEQMRQNNVRLIFEHIYQEGGITKTQLAGKTGLSVMAVGRIADFLLEQGLVEEHENASLAQGRPAKLLSVNRTAMLNVGVSLDAGGVYIGLIDAYGAIVRRWEHRFAPGPLEPEETLARLAEWVLRFLREDCVQAGMKGPVQAIGLAMPGFIDDERGLLKTSTQMHWANLPLAEMLQRHAGMPGVVLENDLKARAQAENRFGAGREYKNHVLLAVGSGVGAGIIIDNHIYRGKDNMAGEIGHIVLNANNRMCECGRFGCLQATITEAALLQDAQNIQPGINIGGLFEAGRQGLPWARKLLDHFADYIMMTINLLANAYAPEAIILCGSLIDGNTQIQEAVSRSYSLQYPVLLSNNFDLKFSAFGPDGNIIGASTVAFLHTLNAAIAHSPGGC